MVRTPGMSRICSATSPRNGSTPRPIPVAPAALTSIRVSTDAWSWEVVSPMRSAAWAMVMNTPMLRPSRTTTRAVRVLLR